MKAGVAFDNLKTRTKSLSSGAQKGIRQKARVVRRSRLPPQLVKQSSPRNQACKNGMLHEQCIDGPNYDRGCWLTPFGSVLPIPLLQSQGHFNCTPQIPVAFFGTYYAGFPLWCHHERSINQHNAGLIQGAQRDSCILPSAARFPNQPL